MTRLLTWIAFSPIYSFPVLLVISYTGALTGHKNAWGGIATDCLVGLCVVGFAAPFAIVLLKRSAARSLEGDETAPATTSKQP